MTFARASRSDRCWSPILIGAFSLVLPILLGIGLAAVAMMISPLRVTPMAGVNPAQLKGLTAAEVIAEAKKSPNSTAPWDELELRAQQGMLQSADVDAGIALLVDHVATQRAEAASVGLHWQLGFISEVLAGSQTSQAQRDQLGRLVWGDQLETLPPYHTRGKALHFRLDLGGLNAGRLDGFEVRSRLVKMTIDGQPVTPDVSFGGGQQLSGQLQRDRLPADDAPVHVVVETGVFKAADAVGLEQTPAVEDWPPTVARWTSALTTTVAGLKEGSRDIALVTDADMNPQTYKFTPGIAVADVVARRSGEQIAIAFEIEADHLPLPVSFDVECGLEGQTHEAGTWAKIIRNNGRTEMGGTMTFKVPNLKADTNRLTITFKPNARHVKEWRNVSEIWGEEVVLKDVKLRRLDLQQGADE